MTWDTECTIMDIYYISSILLTERIDLSIYHCRFLLPFLPLPHYFGTCTYEVKNMKLQTDTDRQRYTEMDRQTDGQTDRQRRRDRETKMDEQTDRDGRTDRQRWRRAKQKQGVS